MSSVYDTYLWKLVESKAMKDRLYEYVVGVREVCDFGIERAKLIRDTFPLYTLHDETHICNVLHLMHELLGNRANELSRDEAATLVLCACCHDVGMSFSEEEKAALLKDKDRIDKYLNQRPGEYARAYAAGFEQPVLDDAMQRSFFRSIHHERVDELLCTIEWPDALAGKVDRDVVVRVCESHGNDVATLDNLEGTFDIDLRMCAVLLRLADILDFDDSRAKKTIYEYCGFGSRTDAESAVSAMEWQKHRGSKGFKFPSADERKHAYELEYHASCNNPQVEQGVRCYLDWVDKELRECGYELARYTGRWQDLALPQKVKRLIASNGYESGEYRLTLEQDKVLDLLVGNDLYTDQSVFVRELIQNAIDAVRTRQQLDKYLPNNWEPRIDIRTWSDNEGYHWFRIEDNGVGMTKDTILNHLLKVGSSYYTSDTFRREKILHHASTDYAPISRFGIGILSCFMADDGSAQVEISTKHYEEGTPRRLRIDGTSGFYRLSNKDKRHHPGPMQGTTHDERSEYLTHPGTAIAVRTNLYALGIYGGFKEIVDKYVAFPQVAIHYEGEDEGVFDYPTEKQLVTGVCGANGSLASVVDLPIPADAVEQIQRVWPEFSWPKDIGVQLGRLSLGAYAASSHVSGAAVVAWTTGDFPTFTHRFGTCEIKMQAHAHLDMAAPYTEDIRTIGLRVVVRPTGDTNNEFDRIIPRYKRFVYPESDSADIVREYKKSDPCLADTLDAMRKPDTLDDSWRDSMRERYGLTEEELNQQVERARNIIGQHTGLEPKEIDLALCLSKTREWRFVVCDLASLGWFKKWFGDSHARTGRRMLVAHNGVSCGSAESLFCNKDGDSHCVAAILLLKDKYRPVLGLARDEIRGYTLETQLVLELMRRRIQADGYYLGEDYPTRGANYHLLAAAAYEDVLASNKALASELTLAVNWYAEVRITDLLSAGQDRELELYAAQILMWDDYSGTLTQRYQRFCLARAQQEFTIRARFGSSSDTWKRAGGARLFPKGEHDLPQRYPQGYRLFPPAFFVLPLTQEDTHLSASYAGRRHWINAEHQLSRFLLQNAKTLHDRTPGIFAEFTRCLAEDDADDLIRTVNKLIERLRKLHNSSLHIPAELKLTEDDLF